MNDINVENITKKHEILINKISEILLSADRKENVLIEFRNKKIKIQHNNSSWWFFKLEENIDLSIYFNSELKILEIGIESSNFYEVFNNIKKSDNFFKMRYENQINDFIREKVDSL